MSNAANQITEEMIRIGRIRTETLAERIPHAPPAVADLLAIAYALVLSDAYRALKPDA